MQVYIWLRVISYTSGNTNVESLNGPQQSFSMAHCCFYCWCLSYVGAIIIPIPISIPIIFTLGGPLLIFSTANPVSTSNLVERATLTFGIADVANPNTKFELLSTSSFESGTIEASMLDELRAANLMSKDLPDNSVQNLTMSFYSDTTWNISPPRKQRFTTLLSRDDVRLAYSLTLRFLRNDSSTSQETFLSKTILSPDVGWDVPFLLPMFVLFVLFRPIDNVLSLQDIAGLQDMLQGNVTTNPIPVKGLIPTIIQLPRTLTVVNATAVSRRICASRLQYLWPHGIYVCVCALLVWFCRPIVTITSIWKVTLLAIRIGLSGTRQMPHLDLRSSQSVTQALRYVEPSLLHFFDEFMMTKGLTCLIVLHCSQGYGAPSSRPPSWRSTSRWYWPLADCWDQYSRIKFIALCSLIYTMSLIWVSYARQSCKTTHKHTHTHTCIHTHRDTVLTLRLYV